MSALADMQASGCQAGVVVGVILVHSPQGDSGSGSGHCRCSAGVLASCFQPIPAPARCLHGLRGEALGLWGGWGSGISAGGAVSAPGSLPLPGGATAAAEGAGRVWGRPSAADTPQRRGPHLRAQLLVVRGPVSTLS